MEKKQYNAPIVETVLVSAPEIMAIQGVSPPAQPAPGLERHMIAQPDTITPVF